MSYVLKDTADGTYCHGNFGWLPGFKGAKRFETREAAERYRSDLVDTVKTVRLKPKAKKAIRWKSADSAYDSLGSLVSDEGHTLVAGGVYLDEARALAKDLGLLFKEVK